MADPASENRNGDRWLDELREQTIYPFLLKTRIGVDTGERYDGIVIEKGERDPNTGKVLNKILHGEVCADFHDLTLKDRRQVRRGRRTRDSARSRLAHLRSWVLRQPDPTKASELASWRAAHPGEKKLPKHLRLPDPYDVMRDKPHWKLTEQERKGGNQYPLGNVALGAGAGDAMGNQPDGCVRKCVGKRATSEEFVRALTLIFRKRGYSYSDAELESLNDKKLAEFLGNACLPEKNERFLEKVRAQVEKRDDANIREGDDQLWRGKNPSDRVNVHELRRLFEEAKQRKRQPRTAQHRRHAVDLLHGVIRGFGEGAGLPSETIEDWQKKLAGPLDQEDFDVRKSPKGLLNKVVRQARFENRVKSGCAWCGKTAARKTKNRDKAFHAAVNNLRVYDLPPVKLKLGKQRQETLIQVWQQGADNPEQARVRMLHYARQWGLARQVQRGLSGLFEKYPAKANEYSEAVKKLRVNLPGRKPRRLRPEEVAKFTPLWTGELDQTISEIHAARRRKDSAQVRELESKLQNYIRDTEVKVKSLLKELHAQEEMAKQLIDLLTVTPTGRHRLCKTCMEAAARGKTMFDMGIDPWTVKERKARNPKREEHDTRLLARLEYLLWKAKVCNPHDVKFITIEFAKPESTKKLKKGEQAATEQRTDKSILLEQQGGRCIYCNRQEEELSNPMEIEHIFPERRGGPRIRDLNLAVSCDECNRGPTGKNSNLPFEWHGNDSDWWSAFVIRVRDNPKLSPRKKDILLLGSHGGRVEDLVSYQEFTKTGKELSPELLAAFKRLADWRPGQPFPDNPTALARAGSMPRQFIQSIRKMFERHGFEGEQLPVITPKGPSPLIQRTEGWLTAKLRDSFRRDAERKADNFPEKRREDSLEHHVEDAALLAALPPHQWREKVFVDHDLRPKLKDGKPVVDAGGEPEQVRVGGLALRELCPNWSEFRNSRKTIFLKPLGRYSASWRSRNLDENALPKKPRSATGVREYADGERCYQRNRLDQIKRKDLEAIHDPHWKKLLAEWFDRYGVGSVTCLNELFVKVHKEETKGTWTRKKQTAQNKVWFDLWPKAEAALKARDLRTDARVKLAPEEGKKKPVTKKLGKLRHADLERMEDTELRDKVCALFTELGLFAAQTLSAAQLRNELRQLAIEKCEKGTERLFRGKQVGHPAVSLVGKTEAEIDSVLKARGLYSPDNRLPSIYLRYGEATFGKNVVLWAEQRRHKSRYMRAQPPNDAVILRRDGGKIVLDSTKNPTVFPVGDEKENFVATLHRRSLLKLDGHWYQIAKISSDKKLNLVPELGGKGKDKGFPWIQKRLQAYVGSDGVEHVA